ncbi:MAG: hypothetical protein A2X49_10135 [Lentisphaerae bacterium GWF2_52_8]|nr:MAG: hypothetical protein A2X49_10135 [Lentisphaerae bacterium GWF2_52_8]
MRNILFGLLLGLLAGCSSSTDVIITDKDKLNGAELSKVISFARGFIANAKNAKFSSSELDIINRYEPEMRIHYTGYKKGRIVLVWLGVEQKEVQAIGEGYFLDEEDCHWSLKVVKSETVFKKPGKSELPLAGALPKMPAVQGQPDTKGAPQK